MKMNFTILYDSMYCTSGFFSQITEPIQNECIYYLYLASFISLIVYQEFDLRLALPLGVMNAALNTGLAAGVILPLAREPTGSTLPLPEKFYLGGNRSLVCRLGGPSPLLGFKSRGLGVKYFGTSGPDISKNGASTSPELNGRGGDIAVTAFADLSFDIPLKALRDLGIHCHAFASAGNLAKLAEYDLWEFPLTDFLQSFRSSVGFGVIVPTRLFRVEVCPLTFFRCAPKVIDEVTLCYCFPFAKMVFFLLQMNYCHILKQFDHDKGKSGIQFNFSRP
jgi:outer membrane protein insertion porin family